MKNIENEMMRLFDEMLKKGLISTGSLWVEIAIEQRNSKLPIAIANSGLLTYDRIDRKILSKGTFN
jgi:hypothetical protein